jgi:hypothetical protein
MQVIKRLFLMVCAAALVSALGTGTAFAQDDCTTPKQDNGNAPAKLSFCGTDAGGSAHWQHDENDSPNDDNLQDIEMVTTAPAGFARIDVMHVFGTPTAEYPNSSYEVKSNTMGPSLGSPRLVVNFSDGGSGHLRPLTNTTSWQAVTDGNWDNNGGTCGFVFQTTWQNVQSCHAGTFVTSVHWVADPYGFTHWFDNLNTAGRVWDEAQDNGNNSSE